MSKSQNIYIERPLIGSLAFKELPGTASKVLLWFKARRKYRSDKVKGSKQWTHYNKVGSIIRKVPGIMV